MDDGLPLKGPGPGALIDYLRAISLFRDQPDDVLRALAGISIERKYSKGEMIFAEGDPAAGFFVVMSGRVKISKWSPEGKEQILHMFGPGEPFGEVAVFADINFPASAESLETSTVLFLPTDRFLLLIRDNPALVLRILAVLSARLQKFTRMIEDLSLKDVPGRLATYLLLLRKRQGGAATVTLDLTKVQLASLLGTIPETLSRIFSRMSGRKLIRVHGSRIEIIDRKGLEGLAQGRIPLP